ncbi:site-specific integrase [Halobacteriaceae archaeon SHR40]|uniref:tyrosine-type recombinase/integrase n=1 Tax=Halovenus amylolytica TaxID=2500550 RepID=UPI000FE3A2B3
MQNPEDAVAEAFGLEGDPLAELNPQMKAIDTDWFEYYYGEFVDNKDITGETKDHYQVSFRDWKQHMSQYDRHPTLPTERQIEAFVDACLSRMKGTQVRQKLNHVKSVYEWMQQNPRFPHPTSYNPFLRIKEKREADLENERPNDHPKVELEELSEVVKSIKHVGERAVTVFQLKTGIRSSELANIRMEDIHISNPDVLNHYESMGTHDQLDDAANAVYIPPEDAREGNKRERPTVIPLDDETRRVLIDWLLIRPDNDAPWLFLTQKGKQMKKSSLGHVWRKHWWPEYEFDAGDEFRSITPHWSRHWMSTWFRTQAEMEEPKVQYLRGDTMGGELDDSRSAFHRYVHMYYDDVESEYREGVFKLGI